MIDKTIEKIESKIKNAQKIEETNKSELLNLVSSLKTEINDLSKTHSEHAEKIANFAEVTATEATKDDKDQDSLDSSVSNLHDAVGEFEVTHPKITEVVNQICMMLSNSGM